MTIQRTAPGDGTVAIRTHRPAGRRFDWGQPFATFIALLVCAVAIGPVVYVFVGGFRTTADINAAPGGWPDPWVLENWVEVLTAPRFWGSLLGSVILAVATTAGVILLGIMAAYPLARYAFRGRQGLYTVFAAGLMFPLTVAVLPLYFMIRTLGLTGSLWGLVIPQIAFALPVTVIIMRPFLRAIPRELEEAAFVDGVTRVGFFWRIVLPLARPGMVTVGVLAFIGSWNAYLLPLLLLTGPQDGMTLPLGVTAFQGEHSAATTLIMAYTSLSMIPALIFFLMLERRIVDGLTGAVKG